MSSQNQSAIATLILSAAGSFVSADKALSKATEGRTGGYTDMVKAAIMAQTREAWDRETDEVFRQIRQNVDGIAKKLGCRHGKGRKGKPAGYLIPGSLSNAKSILGYAFDQKVALQERDDDGKTSPRKFGAIREDVTENNRAATVAGLTGRERSVHLVREMAGQVADAADAFTDAELPQVLEALTKLVKVASGAVSRAEKAEAEASKGADLAAQQPKAAGKAA